MSHFILSVQGPNRSGIVAELSGLLHRYRVNIMDSSMTTLRSEFVVMMLLELPAELSPARLEAEFPQLQGLRLHLQPISAETAQRPEDRLTPTHAISVVGPDQTGIVYRVSAVLAAHGLNICDVDTQLLQRGDQTVYAMVIELHAPQVEQTSLSQELQVVAQELGIDLHLHALAYAEI
ncbi:MAG: glycine cleavage system protein R [Candidatus Sericytochromatia bacterium]